MPGADYAAVKRFRSRRKQKCLDYKGGKCQVCGYDKCNRALDFHHINESTKSFTISKNTNKAWATVKPELDKCVLVCCRCHQEIHDGIIPCPLL